MVRRAIEETWEREMREIPPGVMTRLVARKLGTDAFENAGDP